MKKIILMMIAMTISFASFAQNKDVTKFLGIPVDGTKTEMKQKLIAKGFVPKKLGNDEWLEGEFNGIDVRVRIFTIKNKVWRIMLDDKNTVDESLIKIRFNRLVEQFENNKRYISIYPYTLSDEVNISYEMAVNKKIYYALFYQVPNMENADTLALQKKARNELLSKYTEAELKNPSEGITKEIQNTATKIGMKMMFVKPVWFRICDYFGAYYISMFYDNKYNQADGEDL